MRVIVTADTHYQPAYHLILERFVQEIAALSPDCLIVAGDVGGRIADYGAMLQLLQALPCPRLILTGNHDLWALDGVNSAVLWEDVLPGLTRDYGCIWLEGENWTQQGIGVCGTNGWYDYSAREPAIALTDDQYFAIKDQYIADGSFVNWPWTDVAFANRIGQAFSERLARLDADPTIREILVVTHVPAFEQAVRRRPALLDWSITNAYFYNLTLGQRILTSRKVRRVVSGHTHTNVSVQIQGSHGMIDMRVVPAQYERPAYVVLDYPDESLV